MCFRRYVLLACIYVIDPHHTAEVNPTLRLCAMANLRLDFHGATLARDVHPSGRMLHHSTSLPDVLFVRTCSHEPSCRSQLVLDFIGGVFFTVRACFGFKRFLSPKAASWPFQLYPAAFEYFKFSLQFSATLLAHLSSDFSLCLRDSSTFPFA